MKTTLIVPPPAPSAGADMFRLVQQLPEPIMLLNAGGVVISANEAMHKVLGLDPVGQHLAVAIRAPAVLAAMSSVFAGAMSGNVTYEVHGARPRQFEAYVAAFAPGLALLQLRDLTREQQIERMRADFVANASHELRTPLAALSGFIETLQGAARNDAAARDRFLDLMRTQALRMKRLIDDLLSLSRIEMNENVRPSETVDLADVARQVADLMQEMARAEDCAIILHLDEALPVKGDRDELVQVVQNLVENAVKYAHAGKRIELTGQRDGRHAVLAVRDHGPGIAEEHIPRLTERFYRVSVQESRSRGGTGLGLAIVKHILNRHRGRLEITSTRGEGSSFAVRLPAA